MGVGHLAAVVGRAIWWQVVCACVRALTVYWYRIPYTDRTAEGIAAYLCSVQNTGDKPSSVLDRLLQKGASSPMVMTFV